MPGINLSQSAAIAEQNEHRATASDKAVYVTLFLLLVAGIAYGVLWYFSFSLNKKQVAIEKEIASVKSSYASDAMLRVAKSSIKADAVLTKRLYPDVNPIDELLVINKNILPDIVLSSYENDLSTNTVKIMGQAPAFFRVAQQMKVLQGSGNFSLVVLSGPLVQDDKGQVSFSLDLTRVSDQKKN